MDRLIAWLQVVGNLGLIAGLVLVAVQIDQSSDLARAQLAHDAWLSSQEFSASLMGENPHTVLAKMWLGENPLTDEELVAANAYFDAIGESFKRIEYTNRAGLEIYSTESAARLLASGLSSRFGRAWWVLNRDKVGRDAPSIRDQVDELLASETADTDRYYAELRDLIED